MKIAYVKVIGRIAFIFMTVNFLLSLIGKTFINDYVFFLMVIFNILLILKNYPNVYCKLIAEIAVMLPILLIKDNFAKAIALLICLIITFLYKKDNEKLNYGEEVDNFKKYFLLSSIIIILSWMKMSTYNLNQYIISYAVMYVIFTIVFLRYLRNYEYGIKDKKINTINLIYSIIVIALSFILAIKSLRDLILNGLSTAYNGIVNVILYISFWPYTAINSVISGILKDRHVRTTNLKGYVRKSRELSHFMGRFNSKTGSNIDPNFHNTIIIVTNILLLLVAILVINKILKKSIWKKNNNEEYTETKETILKEKDHSKLITKVKKLFAPSDYTSSIKYYYKNFMEECVGKGIEINKSDTTRDINLKAENTFNHKSLRGMRQLYLKAKYSKDPSNSQEVEEFKKLYNDRHDCNTNS